MAPHRAEYPYLHRVTTRWADNDVYGHVNNVEYYALFDTGINAWLIEQGGLDIHAGVTIGLCAESHCRFLAPIAFPGEVEVGVRVAELGNSSVRYELAIFAAGEEAAAAEGWFVHVFVSRESRRPEPIPEPLADSLRRLRVED